MTLILVLFQGGAGLAYGVFGVTRVRLLVGGHIVSGGGLGQRRAGGRRWWWWEGNTSVGVGRLRGLTAAVFRPIVIFGRFWLLVKIEGRWKWTLVSRFLGAETLRVDACRAWQCSAALGAEIMVPAPSARRSSSGVFGM